MAPVVLPHRPRLTHEQAVRIASDAGLSAENQALLIGVRGIERDTMGMPGENDRGMYDDAVAILSPTALIVYNANTDPSEFGKGKASLEGGVWTFALGTHNRAKPVDKQYEALVQAGKFTVRRDDTAEFENGVSHPNYGACLGGQRWTNNSAVPSFGLNVHRGGTNTTGSEGCQTIYKPQWDSFIATVKMEMVRHKQKVIQYMLTERLPA